MKQRDRKGDTEIEREQYVRNGGSETDLEDRERDTNSYREDRNWHTIVHTSKAFF